MPSAQRMPPLVAIEKRGAFILIIDLIRRQWGTLTSSGVARDYRRLWPMMSAALAGWCFHMRAPLHGILVAAAQLAAGRDAQAVS